VQYMTLSAGDDAEIVLFAQRNSERPTYFAYDARDEIVEEPENYRKFHEPRRFKVRIRDGYGQWQRVLIYEVSLRNSDGGLMLTRRHWNGRRSPYMERTSAA